jgi:16S rRNA (guanine527-N7)-methyltransferase
LRCRQARCAADQRADGRAGHQRGGPLIEPTQPVERRHLNARTQLIERARLLDVSLSDVAADQLLELLDELARWGKAYNLTAIRTREEMLTHHILDSLAIHNDLKGTRIADVGTGAGFPGLPLAIANPARHFTLIDSSGKKTRFVAHAARTLALGNVTTVQSRVEDLRPDMRFETVVARAFASIAELTAMVPPLCGPGTQVLAMKGRYPATEIAAVPAPWRVVEARALRIPGLEEARHLVILESSQG